MQAESAKSAFESNIHGLLAQATELGASDLHIEPLRDRIKVRARVDGTLKTIQEIDNPKIFDHFLMKLKRSCSFDMSKLNVPQDSRFHLLGIAYEFRASLIPTKYGEKIVLRCLEMNKAFSLSKYALPDHAKAFVKEALSKWQGLILVSGPTGSGKSTLLFSLLAELDHESDNIHTIEDPIEYTLDGINQTQISPPEITFEKALRALLRQDPDSILVGEIRDSETAHAAMHAASTGHLILSTIHANSASECLERLTSLGVDRKLIESNLLFASAQRLVPKNCSECLLEDDSPFFDKKSKSYIKTYSSKGCKACQGLGIRGRALLFEFIGRGESSEIQQFGSLREDAINLLKKGEIDAKSAAAFCG